MAADKKSNPAQIAQSVYDPDFDAIKVTDTSNLMPNEYDEMIMAYTNNAADPSTITYRLNSVTVAVIGLEYDQIGRVTRVYRQV
jgi:hypothetical protein